MSSERKKIKLSHLARVQGGYAFKSKDFCSEGVPVLKIANIRNKDIDVTSISYISPKLALEFPKYRVQYGDILISMTGSGIQAPASVVGRIARYQGMDDIYLFNQRVGRFQIFDKNIIDPRFLYLALSQESYQSNLVSIATGSGNQVNISCSQIESLEIPFPPIDEQRAIANILGSLDDRIELNRQMCKTLEDIASALFKSWFIEFDPVKANTTGRKPDGLSPEIAKLFPDSFNSNELPSGWHFSVAYDWAEYINGAAYKDSHFTEVINGLPIIKIAELKSGISSGTKYTDVNLGDKYKIDTGNILLSWSGSPETSIDTFLWVGGTGWLNQHIFNVIPKTTDSRAFIYFLLKYLKPKLINIAKNKQTTGLGHITVKDLKELKVVNPGPKLINSFDLIVAPILQRIQQSMEENVYLSRTRNNLLPQLINGSIKVNGLDE